MMPYEYAGDQKNIHPARSNQHHCNAAVCASKIFVCNLAKNYGLFDNKRSCKNVYKRTRRPPESTDEMSQDYAYTTLTLVNV